VRRAPRRARRSDRPGGLQAPAAGVVMLNGKKIVVVLPAYNAAKTLERT